MRILKKKKKKKRERVRIKGKIHVSCEQRNTKWNLNFRATKEEEEEEKDAVGVVVMAGMVVEEVLWWSGARTISLCLILFFLSYVLDSEFEPASIIRRERDREGSNCSFCFRRQEAAMDLLLLPYWCYRCCSSAAAAVTAISTTAMTTAILSTGSSRVGRHGR